MKFKNFRLIRKRGAGCVLLGIVVIFAAVWHFHHRRAQVTVAFLERNFPDRDDAVRKRSERFEALHRRTFEEMIDKFNKKDGRFQIRLLPPDATPKPTSAKEYGKYLWQRYQNLKNRHDLLAVFDNCWGKDIVLISNQLQSFPVPVVFLNADRNDINFGRHRFFVGSSDRIPEEVTALVKPLQNTASQITNSNFVFFTETEYNLKHGFERVFKEARLNPLIVEGTEFQVTNVLGVRQVENEISNGLVVGSARSGGAQKKVIVLNGHWRWGDQLLPWLDNSFQDLTVIADESLFSRSINISFGKHGNELILLSGSTQTTPENLFLQYRELTQKYPSIFNRSDAVYYIRRCGIAMNLCTTALAHMNQSNSFSVSPPSEGFGFWNFEGGGIQTPAGLFRFDQNGELLGQNAFLSYRKSAPTTYLRQINYQLMNGQVSSINLLTNIHVGIRKIQIRSVNVEAGTFAVDFDYWLREPASIPDPEKPPLEPLDFKINEKSSTTDGSFGQRLLATKVMGDTRLRLFHVSGIFEQPLDAKDYPFDRYRLNFNLKAVQADDKVRLSCEGIGEKDLAKADGWIIRDNYVALNSRETSPIPISTDIQEGESTQFDTLSVNVDIYRKLYNPIVLIVFPLSLLLIASIAVLYIKFADDTEPKDKETSNQSEAAKSQTELSLGCMLAVITYLISYATLAPRLEKATRADELVIFTLFISVINFIFVVVFSARNSNSFLRYLSLDRYRRLIMFLAGAMLLVWYLGGLLARRAFVSG